MESSLRSSLKVSDRTIEEFDSEPSETETFRLDNDLLLLVSSCRFLIREAFCFLSSNSILSFFCWRFSILRSMESNLLLRFLSEVVIRPASSNLLSLDSKVSEMSILSLPSDSDNEAHDPPRQTIPANFRGLEDGQYSFVYRLVRLPTEVLLLVDERDVGCLCPCSLCVFETYEQFPEDLLHKSLFLF